MSGLLPVRNDDLLGPHKATLNVNIYNILRNTWKITWVYALVRIKLLDASLSRLGVIMSTELKWLLPPRIPMLGLRWDDWAINIIFHPSYLKSSAMIKTTFFCWLKTEETNDTNKTVFIIARLKVYCNCFVNIKYSVLSQSSERLKRFIYWQACFINHTLPYPSGSGA